MTATEAILYLVLGLGPGAVYAGLGFGLVITYRGSGFINLAYGAMAMYPTVVFAELRETGNLVLPGVPGTYRLASHVPTVCAFAIALVVAALLGLLTYCLVVRPLRRAPPLARVVGAVGLLITLQAVVTLRFGTDPQSVNPLLPQHTVAVSDFSVPLDRLYLVGLLAILVVVATFLYAHTRFGVASRGATESETAAELLGHSPVLLGAVNWVIGAVVAAVFGILLAPIAGLSPTGYSLLVVPALVAALAGRLVSMAGTVAAGLALGLLQSLATGIPAPWAWFGPQTIKTVLPFVALVVVLVVVGGPTPPRGAGQTARLPSAPAPSHPVRSAAVLLVVGIAATFILESNYRSALTTTMIGAVLCLSLVILTGYAGQVSLAQMSFAGIGGFVLSGVATDWGLPFPTGLLGAVIAASACGVVLGLPAMRTRGMELAIMTLGAALAVEELVFRNLSDGIIATNSVGPPRLAGLDLAPTAPDGTPGAAYTLFVASVLAFVSLAVMRLRTGSLGRRMLAVRSNERAAAAAGVNVGRTKLFAFGLSASVAGLGGTLAAYHQTAVSDQSFSINGSLVLLAVAYLGGIGSVAGAIVGGLVIPGGLVPTITERLLDLGRYQTLFAGMAVTALAVLHPEGLASTLRRLWKKPLRREQVT